jgi:hypothetical protein
MLDPISKSTDHDAPNYAIQSVEIIFASGAGTRRNLNNIIDQLDLNCAFYLLKCIETDRPFWIDKAKIYTHNLEKR